MHWLDQIDIDRGVIGKVKKKPPVKADAVVNTALNKLNAETDALRGAGFSEDQVKFNLIKDWMESGAYTSTGAKVNNPGNIMFGKNNIRATKGPYIPSNKSYLAAYKSLGDYALDLKRVLSMTPGRPIDATGYPDLTNFVKRLKQNNYFGKESESSYLNKLKGAQQRLRLIQQLEVDTYQDVEDNVPADKNNFIKEHPIWSGVIAAFLGVVAIKIVSN